MNLVLLCSWSAILAFTVMIHTKYHWRQPPLATCFTFAVAGIASAFPALIYNWFIAQETAFWVFSHEPVMRFMGFFISAGLGEEFWKMGFGCIVCFLWIHLRKPISESDVVIGFVSLGLAFAGYENLLSYSDLGSGVLIYRGFITIPIHGGMGMIHGKAAYTALQQRSAIPLFTGYAKAVTIHTFCDTWNIVLPYGGMRIVPAAIALLLVVWAARQWRDMSELPESGVVGHEGQQRAN